jgi:hypothetical protein
MYSPYTDNSASAFQTAAHSLPLNNIPLESFVQHLLSEPGAVEQHYISNFINMLPHLLQHLATNPQTQSMVNTWIKETYLGTLKSQVCELTKPKHGFHFTATSITAEQIQECSINHIEEGIVQHAPELWELVGELLQAGPNLSERRRSV